MLTSPKVAESCAAIPFSLFQVAQAPLARVEAPLSKTSSLTSYAVPPAIALRPPHCLPPSQYPLFLVLVFIIKKIGKGALYEMLLQKQEPLLVAASAFRDWLSSFAFSSSLPPLATIMFLARLSLALISEWVSFLTFVKMDLDCW